MNKLPQYLINVALLLGNCYFLENGNVKWLSLSAIILTSINILVLCQKRN